MSALADRIRSLTGHKPDLISPLSGGCVGDVYQVSMPNDRDLVAKVGDANSGLKLEGRMLDYLARRSPLPVPQVVFSDDTLLLMTLLESGGGLGVGVQEHGAELVAALHAVTTDQGFGFDYDTVIGGLHQPNPWTASWLDFFCDQRLLYMGSEAERAGRLPTQVLIRLKNFAAHLDRWLDEPDQPSLLHGDMWTGNVLSAGGRISGFVDPALYFGHAEIELAFTTMFGTFSDAFFDRYGEIRPIKPGFFEERRDIYNLYPLLVHVRLFGGQYVTSVEHTLNRFGF